MPFWISQLLLVSGCSKMHIKNWPPSRSKAKQYFTHFSALKPTRSSLCERLPYHEIRKPWQRSNQNRHLKKKNNFHWPPQRPWQLQNHASCWRHSSYVRHWLLFRWGHRRLMRPHWKLLRSKANETGNWESCRKMFAEPASVMPRLHVGPAVLGWVPASLETIS